MDDKKGRKSASSGRPYLLRRSTASGAGGSIKRRSFRFKKSGNKDPTKDSSESRKTSGKESSTESTKKGGMKDKSSDSRKSDAGSHKEKSGSRDDDRKYQAEEFRKLVKKAIFLPFRNKEGKYWKIERKLRFHVISSYELQDCGNNAIRLISINRVAGLSS